METKKSIYQSLTVGVVVLSLLTVSGRADLSNGSFETGLDVIGNGWDF
jgi:hypothetical protein